MTTETDVLQETVTRVESLAENIGNLTGKIRTNVAEAMHNLGPLAQRAGGSTSARQRIDGLLSDLEDLRPIIQAVQHHEQIIMSGLLVEGPEKYGESWTALGDIYSALTTNHRQYHGLITQVTNLQQRAEQESHDLLHGEMLRVFSEDDVPHPDDVSTLQQMVVFLEAHGMAKQIHVMATTQVRIATTKAVQAHSHRIETTAAIKKFKAFHQQYLGQQQELLGYLFPAHYEEYLELQNEIFEAEEQQLAKKVGRLSQGKAKGDMGVFDEIETATELEPERVSQLIPGAADRLRALFAGILGDKAPAPDVGISPAVEKLARTIRQLAKNRAAVLSTLQSQPPRFYLPQAHSPEWLKGFPITSRLPDLLDLYFADMLEQVFYSLSQAAGKSNKTPAQQGLFLINNTSFVQHFLASNGGLLPPKGVAETRLQKHHNTAIKLYLSDWQRLSLCLMEASGGPDHKLKKQEREDVKERFRQFNTEFEVLVDKQRKAPIPDKDLRLELSRAISGIIQPLYQRFYDKHSGGDFTKNLDKYVKYDPKKLEQIFSTM